MTELVTISIGDLSMRDALDIQVVRPRDAATWIAYGCFRRPMMRPVMDWVDVFDEHTAARHDASDDARITLAQDLIFGAILAGKLRCAFVERGVWGRRPTGVGLKVADQAVFEGASVDYEWDDAPDSETDMSIYVDRLGEETVISRFWLLWPEVAAFRPQDVRLVPDRTNDWLEPVRAEVGGAEVPPLDSRPQRGRRPKRHGGAIAAFVAEAEAVGAAALASEKDAALGERLLQHYKRLDEPPPDPSNAARDARAALDEWIRSKDGASSAASEKVK